MTAPVFVVDAAHGLDTAAPGGRFVLDGPEGRTRCP